MSFDCPTMIDKAQAQDWLFPSEIVSRKDQNVSYENEEAELAGYLSKMPLVPPNSLSGGEE